MATLETSCEHLGFVLYHRGARKASYAASRLTRAREGVSDGRRAAGVGGTMGERWALSWNKLGNRWLNKFETIAPQTSRNPQDAEKRPKDAPRTYQTLPRRSKARPRRAQDAPRRHKTPPRCPKAPPRRHKTPARRAQDAPKTPQADVETPKPFWIDFPSIFGANLPPT